MVTAIAFLIIIVLSFALGMLIFGGDRYRHVRRYGRRNRRGGRGGVTMSTTVIIQENHNHTYRDRFNAH